MKASSVEKSATPDAEIRDRLAQIEQRLDELEPPRKTNPATDGARPWRRWMPRFLKVLGRTGNASAAIRAVGLCRATVYKYRQRCQPFSEGWAAAVGEREPAAAEIAPATAGGQP